MFRALCLFAAVWAVTISASTSGIAGELPKASAERMENRIMHLSQFGRNADGGVDRVAYTDADIAGRTWLIGEMEKIGLEVSIDFAGNILGKRAGMNPSLAPIMFGSHSDSVPGGGNYDGDVGVIGALEAIEMMNTANIVTDHPLEVIIFADEEGGTVGSMALAGILPDATLKGVNASGYNRGDGVDRLGGNQKRINEVARKSPIHAFVELHIEQGGFLEKKQLNIGIVEGIVGIRWWDVTVTGVANHGGTTPMPGRKDALVAASRLVIVINERVTTMDGRQVATVGKIEAFPGAPNVIPGTVKMALEIRDLESSKIQHVYEVVQAEAEKIAAEMGVDISFKTANVDIHPAPTNTDVRRLIESSVNDLGLTYQYMPSGAGHDAQDMAQITPTGMIFVPSRGGVSHSPREYTSPADMANGADVLLRTILKLDKVDFSE